MLDQRRAGPVATGSGGDGRRHVLVVDDEIAVLTTVRYVLGPEVPIITVSSAEEALKLLTERDDIAAIVTDQRMPGMTGIELCERVRTLRPSVRRLVLTAYPDVEVAIDAMNRGGVHHFETKPPRMDVLRELLLEAVEGPSSDAAAADAGVDGEAPVVLASAVQVELAHDLRKFRQAFAAHVERISALARESLREHPGTAAAEAAGRRLATALADARTALAFLDDLADELGASADEVLRLQHIDGVAPCADAGSVAAAVCRLLRPTLDATTDLSVRIDAEPTVVPVRRLALGHVLLNLVRNAIDAVAERTSGPAAIEVRVRRSGQSVFLEVGDTGPGIAIEDIERIFERSFTRKPGGTGLGLCIARTIVVASGGRISAHPRVEGGVMFVAELPAVEPVGAGDADPAR